MVQATIIVNIAIVEGDRLLLVQEGKDYCRGQWGLPGGRVEPGERLADAALREVTEETGLSVELDGIVRISRYTTARNNHCIGFTFGARPLGGDLVVDGSEILRASWISFVDLGILPDAELRSPAVFRAILDDVMAGRRLPFNLLYDVP